MGPLLHKKLASTALSGICWLTLSIPLCVLISCYTGFNWCLLVLVTITVNFPRITFWTNLSCVSCQGQSCTLWNHLHTIVLANRQLLPCGFFSEAKCQISNFITSTSQDSSQVLPFHLPQYSYIHILEWLFDLDESECFLLVYSPLFSTVCCNYQYNILYNVYMVELNGW